MISILLSILAYLASDMYVFPDEPVFVHLLVAVAVLIISQLLVLEKYVHDLTKDFDQFMSLLTSHNEDGSQWAMAKIRYEEVKDDDSSGN